MLLEKFAAMKFGGLHLFCVNISTIFNDAAKILNGVANFLRKDQ